MKDTETKLQFIQLRAEGNSYRSIAKKLKISKSTCEVWSRELAQQINGQKREYLEELLESYKASKAGRIKALGDTLKRIDTTLKDADLSKVDAGRLLDYKLKYMEALKNEYVGVSPVMDKAINDGKGIIAALGDLLDRVRAGDIPQEQAQKETTVLVQLIRAFDTVEVKAKIEELETIMESRKPYETQNTIRQ